MNKNEYKKIIKKSQSPDAFTYADEIMRAYEKLDELDCPDFTSLKMEYLRGELKSPMKDIFQNYLFENRSCLEELMNFKNLIKSLNKFSLKEVHAVISAKKYGKDINQSRHSSGKRSRIVKDKLIEKDKNKLKEGI